MENTFLYNKLAALPEHLKMEVSDFIDFLTSKTKKQIKQPISQKPKFGSGKGIFVMHKDFDEPLDDFKEYMEQ
jgi:hypothetical protein